METQRGSMHVCGRLLTRMPPNFMADQIDFLGLAANRCRPSQTFAMASAARTVRVILHFSYGPHESSHTTHVSHNYNTSHTLYPSPIPLERTGARQHARQYSSSLQWHLWS